MKQTNKNQIILNPRIREGKGIKILVGAVMVIFIISFASAGLFDWLKKDDLKEKPIKELINDTWVKTITKIKMWTTNNLIGNSLAKADTKKELDLTGSTIVIKENVDGVKVLYNAG